MPECIFVCGIDVKNWHIIWWILPFMSMNCPSLSFLIIFGLEFVWLMLKWLYQLVSQVYLLQVFLFFFSKHLLWGNIYYWCWGMFAGYCPSILLICDILLGKWDHWYWDKSMTNNCWFLLFCCCSGGVYVCVCVSICECACVFLLIFLSEII